MRIKDLISMGLRNLWRRKTRTFLTVLGVLIGSSAILLMVSLGLGQERAFQKSLEMFGNIRIIEVDPYGMWNPETGENSEAPELNDQALKMIEEIEGVEAVLGMLSAYVEMQAGKYMGGASVMGVDLDQLETFQYKVSQGRLPEITDKNALVVGASFKDMFYDPRARQWQPVTIDFTQTKLKGSVNGSYDQKGNKKRTTAFMVVGTLQSSGSNDYMVFMDKMALSQLIEADKKKYPTGEKKPTKKDTGPTYERAQVLCESIDDVVVVHETLKGMGFGAYSPIEYVEHEKQKMQMQQMVLGGIGAVSLLIAAIGITNTMIMAIYERTKEIGVMKVLGCDVWDIMKLFLFEAAIIGLIGGVIGVGVSLVGSDIINQINAGMQSGFEMGYGVSEEMLEISYIPVWLMTTSLVFSTCVGVLSGLLPAYRATRLSALEAIRNDG